MRLLQSQKWKASDQCGVEYQALCLVLVRFHHKGLAANEADMVEIGPAHAVYFATYEAVKQAMGGNVGNEHHPLAAGQHFADCVLYHLQWD